MEITTITRILHDISKLADLAITEGGNNLEYTTYYTLVQVASKTHALAIKYEQQMQDSKDLLNPTL
jgi:hypothetical protein